MKTITTWWRRSAGPLIAAAVMTCTAAVYPAASTAAAPEPTISVHPEDGWHPISRQIFGGNNNYGANGSGMYDPAKGRVYPSFVAQTKQSGFQSMRFPGGTMANTYHFARAIGPQDGRTPNMNGVLNDPEPLDNNFGPDEYGRFLDQTGMTGNLMLNFGTGTPGEAAAFVEYMTAKVGTNPDGGTAWAAIRARNGHPAPYHIEYAEVGNEMYASDQQYWMSGSATTPCPHKVNCLYANGGTTHFTDQPTGGYADWRASASMSDGTADQTFYARYPAVKPGSQTVYVAGTPWNQVPDIESAPAGAQVYQLDNATGAIRFGNGDHGAIPPDDDQITITYDSGPHQGFDAYYAAIKKTNPAIKVCTALFSDEFLQLMGSTRNYDCVVQHEYVHPGQGPSNSMSAPDFHDELLLQSETLDHDLADLQASIRQYAGPRAADISTVITEYGALGSTSPKGTEHYRLSLDLGVFVADLLRHWAERGVPLAEKAKLTDYVWSPAPPSTRSVGFPENAMIAGPAPGAVLTPTAQIMQLLSTMTGPTFVSSDVSNNPVRTTSSGTPLDALTTLASRDADGHLYLTVINRDRDNDVQAKVSTGSFTHASQAVIGRVDGPSYLSYNTPQHRDVVKLTRQSHGVGTGEFDYTFPAHSVTTIELSQ